MAGDANSLNSALWAAPDLWNTPSLAVTAASTSDPAATAQGLSHLNQAAALQNTAETATKSHGGSWWSGALHAITGGVGSALHMLNAPLQDIQHQYRYLKDVYTHHGFWAGFGETAAILGAGVGGAVAGSFVGNPELGVLAAEGVSTATSRAFFHDSWKRSATAPGSVGRDLAHLVGLSDTNSGWGKVVSGLGDAAFDFEADPLVVLGKLSAARRSMTGFTEGSRARVLGRDLAVQNNNAALGSFVSRFAPGTMIDSTDRVDNAYRAYGGYRRAVSHIAGLDGAGVVAHYPELQAIATDLGKATSEADVHSIFREVANDAEWRAGLQTSQLPSRSVMRVSATKVLDKLRGDVARQDELPLLFGRSATFDASQLPDNFSSLTAAGQRKATKKATDQSFQLGAVFRPTPGNLQAALSKKIRTFSGYQPYALDENTHQLVGQFDLTKDDNLQGVLRAMRYSMGEVTARKRLQEFIDAKRPDGEADVGQRKAIWKATQVEILKAAGLPDDPELVSYLQKVADRHVSGTMHGEAYGNGWSQGDGVNSVTTPTETIRAALHDFQGPVMASFPDFRELRSAMLSMDRYKKLYGKVDDVAANQYINKYFKPMSLLTGGFGLRVAMSEAIPAAMRYGAWNMLKRRVSITASKMGYQLADGEEHPILSVASKLVGGMDKLVNTDERRAFLAIKSTIDGGSHFTYGVAASNHNIYGTPDDPTQAMHYGVDQSLKRVAKAKGKDVVFNGSGQFDLFAPEDRNFVDQWHYGLIRRARERNQILIANDFQSAVRNGMTYDAAWQDAASREAKRIQGIDPTTDLAFEPGRDPYVKGRQKLVRYNVQDPHEFAAARVDDLRNYVTGRDGTLHNNLLDKIAAKDNNIDPQELRTIEPAARPKAVAGEVMEPYVGPNLLQNMFTTGFDRVVTPIINYISREPLYFNELEKHWTALAPAVKDGQLTEDTAFRIAKTRAMRGILPQIHNTHLRSQLHMALNNMAPFLFAQEQAFKRAGHLVVRNPEAFRKYQLITHALNDPGFVHTDDQGNRYLMIPGLGEVGAMGQVALSHLGLPLVTGLPLTVQGNMASLRTVIPEITPPGTSPFAAIALSKIANLDPGLAGLIKGVVGPRGYDEDWLAALVPNTPLRSAVRGVLGMEGDRQIANSMMTALQAAAYHGDLPGPDASPEDQQAFIDRIKNNARSTFFIKAILSAISPLTPKVDQADYGLRDEFFKLVKTKGSYDAALHAFLQEHGDKAVSYTVAKTVSSTGANISPTAAAVSFISSHEGLLKQHPWGAAFVTPQGTAGGGDAQVLYNELLRNHLRANQTPSDFLNAIYSSMGVQEYVHARDAHEAALAQMTNDPTATAAEKHNFDVWQNAEFRLTNPIAYNYLFGPEKVTNAVQAYQDIVDMYNTGAAPKGQQADLLRGLLNDYEQHRQALASLGTDRSNGHARQVEKDQWAAYLTQVAASQPLLANVVQAVFKRLVSIPESTGETAA